MPLHSNGMRFTAYDAVGAVLAGGYKVRRRAAGLHRQLTTNPEAALGDQLIVLDWVNLYALAVNEENAAGGRVVTAPTPMAPQALSRPCCTATRVLWQALSAPSWAARLNRRRTRLRLAWSIVWA